MGARPAARDRPRQRRDAASCATGSATSARGSSGPAPAAGPGDVFLDVDGRIEDYVVTPDGRWIGRLDHIFKDQLDVAEAQILQETRGGDRGPGRAAAELRARPASAELLKEIRSRLGDEIRIELRLRGRDPARAQRKVPGGEVARSGGSSR